MNAIDLAVYRHPRNVSMRAEYGRARSSVWRFDADTIRAAIDRERARNRELSEAGELRPEDLVYLRACLDELKSRGIDY